MKKSTSWLFVWMWGAMVGGAWGIDFRMENKVYFGNQREPAVETTTIFYNGVVYDFLKKPAEITILENQRRIVLLDTERRVKTHVTLHEVEAFVERLRRRADEYSDPFVVFLGRPEFEHHFDPESRELTLSSRWITYRVLTVDAESAELAEEYRMFADALARLNALLNPKGLPPFPRLVLNAELQRREMIPKEVHLTIHSDRSLFPKKRTVLRSEHYLVRQISEADRTRVQQAIEFQNLFPQISFEQYQKQHLEK
ncbi:MAG: hypothetical protein NZ602_17245 [Thermoguttaceae bacterium]|nr:hypothetical protein [Thermoguttaceae bacterium]MDW8037651.1 hypothetical protein [Thermoguttaceae bacterium]